MATETKTRKIELSKFKQTRHVGILGRSLNAIKSGAFQLGLSAPGRLWYRNSAILSDREKAWLDGEINRVIS